MPLNIIESAELKDDALDERLTKDEAELALNELTISALEVELEKAWLLLPPPPPQADNSNATHTSFMLSRQARLKYTIKTPCMLTPQKVKNIF
jgi:hypothetical protein